MSIYKDAFSGVNGRPIHLRFGKTKFDMFFVGTEFARRLDNKEWKVLSGTGAYTRGVIRRSIKKGRKKKPQGSGPNEPPRYYERGFVSLKDGIFFYGSLQESSVTIGPNALRTKTQPDSWANGAELLEYGGTAQTWIWRETEGTPRGEYVRGYWRKRPYVEPAREPAQEKMKELISSVPV